jgi:hypothetical protein
MPILLMMFALLFQSVKADFSSVAKRRAFVSLFAHIPHGTACSCIICQAHPRHEYGHIVIDP